MYRKIPAFIKDFCKAFPLIINQKQIVSFNYHNSMSDHPNNKNLSIEISY